MNVNKALFLDRDGVVNEDRGYVHRPEDFIVLPHILEVCKAFCEGGYKIIIITNQSGVERGCYTETDLQILNQHIQKVFSAENITITDILYCTSLEETHPDRKPNPGLFLKAQVKHNINMRSSVSIGDKERDIFAAKKAGVGKNILFTQNEVRTAADFTVKHLPEVLSICTL